MRLHTKLPADQLYEALKTVKAAGKMTPDVKFMTFTVGSSRSHARGYTIQLGTYDKHSLPEGYTDRHGQHMHVRRYKNSGYAGSASEGYGRDGASWSATYDEWGWLMAEVFRRDPEARWGNRKSGYNGVDDFHEKTKGLFK